MLRRHSRNPDDLADHHKKRNLATSLMNNERRKFYSDWLYQNSENKALLFSKAKKLLGLNQQPQLPPHNDTATLTQELAEFFVLKVANIRSTFDSTTPSSFLLPTTDFDACTSHQLSEFRELSDQDIISLVSTTNKTCELDPVPSSLIKSSIHILTPVLKKLVNTSLTTGHFCSSWKRAIIRPKLKKPDLDPVYSNYRPLSNLSFVSKITEKAASAQIVEHLSAHHLFPVMQSAYRKFHSTETALLKVKNDILLNMNRQHITLLVLLDLSSAFDTVDHNILLHRLHTCFGISHSALSWFESYLSDRRQFVSIDGATSSEIPVEHGVPQGSCLGPLLFNLYTSPLFEIIKNHLPDIHCYADDTQLYSLSNRTL